MSAGNTWTSKQSRSLDPFFYENTRIVWTLPQPLFKQVQVIFMAYNLLNARYEPNGYSSSYISNQQVVTSNFYFPAAPTNIMAAVNITL